MLSWNLWSALVAVPSFAMKRIALPVLRFPTSNVSTSLEFSFYRDEGPSVADVVKVLVAYFYCCEPALPLYSLWRSEPPASEIYNFPILYR